MRKPATPTTGKGYTAPSAHNRAARRKFQSAKRKAVESDNPEGLDEAPDNSLFGKAAKRMGATGGSEAAAEKPRKAKKEVIKTDPAVQAIAQKKRLRASEKAAAAAEAPPEKRPRSKPHAEAVDTSKHLWEKLRSEKTEASEVCRPGDPLASRSLASALHHACALSHCSARSWWTKFWRSFRVGRPMCSRSTMLRASCSRASSMVARRSVTHCSQSSRATS